MMPDAAVWEDIRVAYETTSETVVEIAARHGIHRSTILKHAKANAWTLRPSGTAGLLIIGAKRAAGITSSAAMLTELRSRSKTSRTRGKATAPPSPALPRRSRSKKSTGGSETHQRAIIERIYDVTDAKLAAIESRIMSATVLKPADAERESREIASILKTIEKLKELSDAFARPSDGRSAGKPADAALANDAERLRQDLADRFARLKDGDANTTPAL